MCHFTHDFERFRDGVGDSLAADCAVMVDLLYRDLITEYAEMSEIKDLRDGLGLDVEGLGAGAVKGKYTIVQMSSCHCWHILFHVCYGIR